MVCAQTESILENGMHQILWNLEIQTDYVIAARKLELVLSNKKKKELSI